MKVALRKIHRWLGLLMAAPIAAWMISGFWFAFNPIEQIRGEHLTRLAEPLAIGPAWDGRGVGDLPPAWRAGLSGEFGGEWSLANVQLVRRDGRLAWRLSGSAGQQPFTRMLDAASGQVWPRLTAEQAEQEALDLLAAPGVVEAVDWVEAAAPGAEIRGRALPLWRVRFSEPESLHLYLDPWTAEIAARRTTKWRVFDFLWMLHILDFETRDDFNHPLLQAAALLGLIVALSGLLLWLLTTRQGRRRA